MRLKIYKFLILFLLLPISLVYAEFKLKIVKPEQGTIVYPGEEIEIYIEGTGKCEYDECRIVGLGVIDYIKKFPTKFKGKVKIDAVGEASIYVACYNDVGLEGVDDKVTLPVEQREELIGIKTYSDFSYFQVDWYGNLNPEEERDIYVIGIYADGVERDLPEESLTYESQDTSVAVVDNKGIIKAKGIGKTQVIARIDEFSLTVDVLVEKAPGADRKEITPPQSSIEIEPKPNKYGWHNQDISIIITAWDDSGIEEIAYCFYGIDHGNHYIETDRAIINFQEEGERKLRYFATDKEMNDEPEQYQTIQIDKTPPQTTHTIIPEPDENG